MVYQPKETDMPLEKQFSSQEKFLLEIQSGLMYDSALQGPQALERRIAGLEDNVGKLVKLLLEEVRANA